MWVVGLGLAGLAHAGQTYVLQPSYPDGRVVLSTFETETASTGAAGNQTSRQKTVSRQQVKGLPDGGAALTVTIQEIDVESADPSSVVIGALADHTYTVEMGPDGSVRDVEGMDQAIRAALGTLDDTLATPEMTEALLASLGDEAMAKNMGSTSQALPTGPVAVGDVWAAEAAMLLPMGMSMGLDYECRLENVVGTLATVRCDVDGDLEMDPTEMMAQMGKLVPGVDLSSADAALAASKMQELFTLERASGTQNLVFDLNSGLVIADRGEMTTVLVIQGMKMVSISKTSLKNTIL